MNILANEQTKIFLDDKSEAERLAIEHSFNKLYFELRRRDENGFLGRLTLKERKRIHWLILLIYTLKNHLGGHTYEIISDLQEKTDRPIIFAVTHVGKFDIEIISEAIKCHYYLLSGDYEHIQGIIDVPFLLANGVLFFNERVKEDRVAVQERMIEHLSSGGNLMYFPEGTWNVSPNLPVLPCYWGIVGVARMSNAIIVPIATEQYGKHFKVNIGKNFDVKIFGDDKGTAINELRDILATLKFQIWETEKQERKNISNDLWDRYLNERFKEWPYFSQTYIERLIFKPKTITEAKEAFSHLDSILPQKSNAFLFSKGNHN